MARYIERAENVARVLDVAYNMSLVQAPGQTEASLWEPALSIAGNEEVYREKYGETSATGVIKYLTMDEDNPSSIYSALQSARENARAVRVAMSSETWENINALWLEFAQFFGVDLSVGRLREFCDWVKSRSHLFRGVSFGTMLRDDAFRFIRLGTFIERADNTARLLDVKYHLLIPKVETGEALDYYEWGAVLRSVSSFEAYQKIYRDSIVPSRVAELLILRDDMPRSLHACFDEITVILDHLSGRHDNECRRLAGELHARLHYGKMSDIFAQSLHEFLEEFIERNNFLGVEIQRTFLNAHGA